jgi:hypothetical protein
MSQQSCSRVWVYLLFVSLFVWAAFPVAGQEAIQATTTTAHSAPKAAAPVVKSALHHAVSKAVRDLPTLVNDANFQAHALMTVPSPLRPLSSSPSLAAANTSNIADAVQQRGAPAAPAGLAPVVSLGFDGLGIGAPGFVITDFQPDANGAVGATQYVQWVNRAFAVYDKVGNLLTGPTSGNALWAALGDDCANNNDGQPIVMYDRLAARWVFSQVSVANNPSLECIAVSTTNDATGTFNLYSFSDPGVIIDQPKLGVWSDAYYAAYNTYDPASLTFLGANICAYDSLSMQNGLPATQVCLLQSDLSITSVLPADFDGNLPPASGEPAYLMSLGGNGLHLFQFHVDFSTPGNSTLGSTVVPVSPFFGMCNGSACVPEPSGTSLESLGDRLMYRVAYRNFGTYEVLVANHSVAIGSSEGGIRWYEIRNPSGTPATVVAQQSTFAPDSSFRWMGSIAMDQSSDIALGYSLSSSSIAPSIAFTGRTTADTPNTMEPETVIINGAGSQTGFQSSWGRYTAMQIDPNDDCTFWYTNEYLKSDGNANWSTRIANFKFPNCGGAQDFSLSISPASLTINQSEAGTAAITMSPINNFSGPVTFSASGLPAGVTAGFSPGSGNTTNLQLAASTGAATGTSTITITGTSGALTHTTTITLTVNPAPPDFSLAVSPSSVSVNQGGTASSTVGFSPINGFNGSVTFTASGLPAGVSATFTPPTTNASSNLVFTATSTATTGPATVTITGTSGALTHTININLTVNVPAPDFSLSASPSSLSVSQNGTGSSTVSVTRINGFNGTVALTTSGLPAGVTAAFNPASATTTSTLTFTVSTTATTGTATVTVTGTSGTLTHTTTISLTITANVLGNPGFENGTNTSPWVLTAGVLNKSSLEPPHSGIWDAWLDGRGTVHTDSATQQVTIPATATSATLSFWLHVDTAETTTTTMNDKLQVQVLNPAGTVLLTLGTFSNLNHAAGYQSHSFSVLQFKGQTIQIRFLGTENSSLQTSFVLDDTNLAVF